MESEPDETSTFKPLNERLNPLFFQNLDPPFFFTTLLPFPQRPVQWLPHRKKNFIFHWIFHYSWEFKRQPFVNIFHFFFNPFLFFLAFFQFFFELYKYIHIHAYCFIQSEWKEWQKGFHFTFYSNHFFSFSFHFFFYMHIQI